ncbi:hypothetical protein HHK36_025765 [Tetracentron sinense]|uniref:NB-ARC domain-containing protein n=1 Tax=Tetracentron sinense TaxID=13715 RepID=A0A834YJD2_TETSI|nr:hypothetical protein HHK36_025765 [Tetracentron sinense]
MIRSIYLCFIADKLGFDCQCFLLLASSCCSDPWFENIQICWTKFGTILSGSFWIEMDALQVFSSAAQIVSSMVGAVGALEQASRNLDEAPKRIRSLEEFVCDLENLTRRIKQKHVYKLQNPHLDHQIQSLNGLVERLHPNVRKARKIVSTRSRIKNMAKVVWNSMAGDPLQKLVNLIKDDLNWWIESQKLTENVEKAIDLTAQNTPVRLRVNSEQGYPTSNKCNFVRNLLEQEGSHQVILIVGLSGIGKSCLARQVASDPPMKFVDGAVELGFGQWCSTAACNGNRAEYRKRLARKICKFLVQIGFWKKIKDENFGDLEYVCCLLQEALYGKRILVLLDDVWEQDIVERFAKLYDNECRYLVTTRNEAVYEITEADKVEICKDDIMEISKAILLYHSLLSEEELPLILAVGHAMGMIQPRDVVSASLAHMLSLILLNASEVSDDEDSSEDVDDNRDNEKPPFDDTDSASLIPDKDSKNCIAKIGLQVADNIGSPEVVPMMNSDGGEFVDTVVVATTVSIVETPIHFNSEEQASGSMGVVSDEDIGRGAVNSSVGAFSKEVNGAACDEAAIGLAGIAGGGDISIAIAGGGEDSKGVTGGCGGGSATIGSGTTCSVAESLLERCGHHPLTVAVMGKALRKEIRAEKWEKAIGNLSTYATCAPGPVSYVNEKEAENTLTIFGSFEFSMEAMPEDSRRLFVALAALSWAEPVPEVCLETLWLVLGQQSLFPLIVCKLVEGSLLIKTDSYLTYHVHDMVSLYLDSKTNDSVEILLTESAPPDGTASITPWLFIFGKETVKMIAEQKMKFFLSALEEKLAVITLEAIVQALMASKSISELEASRTSFSSILGPRIADLISTGSPYLIAVSAIAITNIFSKSDYCDYVPSLETVGAVDKLASILQNCEDPMIQTNISNVLSKIAEYGSSETVDKVLQSIPINRLADLLATNAEEWHESVFTTLMSLTKAGKSKAVEKMFAFGIDKNLIMLFETGSEVAQHHAIVTLKAFYEMGGPLANGSLRPGTLNHLPWHARQRLERFVLPNRNIPLSPKPQTFEDLIHKILERDQKQVLEAMQDLIPIIEKAGDLRIRDMIIKSPLVERLSELLQYGHPEQNSTRSESAFLLTKLACSGGEPCIRKFLEYDIIPDLVKMMQCNVSELQDSAYTALHQMLFGNGGVLILNRILQMGLIERLANSIESKWIKTREVSVHCILDIVELGKKACIERIFSLQVVEKLVKFEKASDGSGDAVVGFLKGMDKCKHLSTAERRLMKQQVVKKVKVALKGHKFEAQIVAAVEAYVSDRSRGASSSCKHRK